ncbi:hypothetical protein [Ensifer sp.]|jgi:hypothetical protein|uniref:hypothetical protein n=1 Tax=Ensifer sp. TaxID=1872086 RepID=UPI002E163633|nr:hypothetical protein [Ensifer sp.]
MEASKIDMGATNLGATNLGAMEMDTMEMDTMDMRTMETMAFSDMMTLPVETRLLTLGRQITALTERLADVSDTAVLRSLDAMQAAGLTMPPAIEPRRIAAVYGYALSGVPACGLTAATLKLIRGSYATNPNVLLGTVPKPPVLAALARAEALTLRAELARKREILASLSANPSGNRRSAASRSRVRALLEHFHRTQAAAKREAFCPRSDGAVPAANAIPHAKEASHAA